MNATIPATKARKQFFKLIQTANQPGSKIIITVEGEAKVVMMPIEEFEGWQETLEIMSDKRILKNIREGIKNMQSGKIYSSKEVKKKLGMK